MTLKEAHEIQRRELMSLRAENKRLQKQTSGLFPVEEKESLERHIRHLEQVIKTNSRRHDSAKLKQAVVLRSDSGGQHICDALTIIETARMQHINV